jgi:predicted  nucleic acid-binding Zn-ribbon protein
MSIMEEVRQLREENAELRRKLVAVEMQLASALERIAELNAQIKQGQKPPGFVKPKRQKVGEEGSAKRRNERQNTMVRGGGRNRRG